MENLELWNEFKETDPKYTKPFKRGGGFSGTATDPIYIIERMTKRFGPNGMGWGWEIMSEDYVIGTPLKKNPDVNCIIHKIQLRLWYKEGGEIYHTSPQFGLTTFVGEYSTSGAFTDEEHAKKSVTDAISKCAVQLGLAADIHMGLYDDNKYIRDLRAKFSEADTPPKAGVDDIPLGGDWDKKGKELANKAKANEPVVANPKLISEPQKKRMFAIAKGNGWPDADVKILIGRHGFESSKDITKDEYEKIVKQLEVKFSEV